MQRSRGLRRAALTAVAIIASLATGLLTTVPASAAPAEPWEWDAPQSSEQRSVPGRAVPVLPAAPDPAVERALRTPPNVTWPQAGAADVATAAVTTAGPPVGRAPVEVLDRGAAQRAGIDGLLLRVPAVDATAGPVRLDVDYSGFRYAYGGDWASRLRLAQMPACALTTPEQEECQAQEPLRTRNDVVAGRVSADLDAAAQDATIVALTATAQGGSGDFKATSLSPSASWQVSPQSGDFSWGYSFRVPPSVGGPSPLLGLSYSSGSVDGRTASTNNQPSWIGEGFGLSLGYIERRYKACADDGVTPKPGDLCWGGQNATMMLNGQATDLVRDDASGAWRPRNDDGSRVELLTGAVNGANGGEHWRVTTTDGTRYFFGLHRLPGWVSGKAETKSTWTVPVFGDDAGEPCHQSTFDASWCQQAWRWNLDYVVDTHGNAMSIFYESEQNYYGRNLVASHGTPYIRGGYLLRIEYSQRDGSVYSSTAPARVLFTVAERCIPTSTFDCAASKLTSSTASYWPDVPFDRNCDAGATCTNNYVPTFWTRKRLTKVATQVLGGTAYRDVDSWALTQAFPAPGDGTSAALWLESIQYTGHVGGTASLPAVNFDGVQMENRVDALEGLAPLVKWRVSTINSETGGRLSINYSAKECVRASNMPAAPDSNTKRCFPQYWMPEGAIDPLLDWFHKYLAVQVVEIDTTGGGPFVVTDYEYLGGTAWHYDEEFLLPANRRTWSQWRGYARVRVTKGDSSEQRSQAEHLFFRGMDGDQLSGGGTRSVTLTDSQGTAMTDHWRLQGFERETTNLSGPGGTVVTGTIDDPWLHGPTATQGSRTAYMLDTAGVTGRTALAAGGWRTTQAQKSFDSYGSVTQVSDLGDTATAVDDRCTRYTYARNTAAWLVDLPVRLETVAVSCAATAARPDDVISDVRTYHDGATTHGTAPTRGDVTRVEELASWSSGPVYVTVSRKSYDPQGRVTDVFDAAGNRTMTAYTPASGGPLVRTVTTNPLGHVATADLEPAWGEAVVLVDANGKRTDLAFDPMARLLKVWLPGRSKASGVGPNVEFGYLFRTTGPVAVSTKRLRADNTYTTSYELLDSLLRPRQTQQPAPGGGRVLMDTFYGSRGQVTKKNDRYYNADPPGTGLLDVADNQVPGQTVFSYDGLERPTVEAFRVLGVERWRTTTTYGGDRTSVDPPDGATATTSILDGRGRMVELRQYRGSAPSGSYDATTYSYAKDGQLASVKDAAGNVWRNQFDLRGRKTRTEDPDKGVTTSSYDDLGQLVSSTDARGSTLAYSYDALGRRTGMFEGSLAGPKLAEWRYDTLAKGQLTSATRFAGGAAYVSAVTGYDSRYRPTGASVTIPAAEGALAGTYSTATTYNLDGTVATTSFPSAGGLPAETLRTGYNELAMPTGLTSATGTTYVGDTMYSKLGQAQQLRMGAPGARVIRAYTYEEGTNRLTRVLTDREVETGIRQADVAYSYDPAGNITKIADTPPPANAASDVQCFRHDYLRRLTEAWTATDSCAGGPSLLVLGGAAPYWLTYGYDVTGNRVSEVQHGASGDVTRTYAYAAAGQPKPHALTSVMQQAPGGSRLDEYGYDAAGNTASRSVAAGSQALEWDVEGRLAKVTAGAGVTTFLYDADGSRLLRRDPTTTTLYLGPMEIRLDRATGQLKGTRYYTHGGTTIAVRTFDNRLTWLVPDHLGTALMAFDAATLSVKRRFITPFGGVRGATPSGWPGERGFVGGTIEVSTGLTHLGAREYEAATGRFISVDPVVDVHDPQQLQAYAYANSSPVTASDPDGRHLCWDENCSPPPAPSAPPPPTQPKPSGGTGQCYEAQACPGGRGPAEPDPGQQKIWHQYFDQDPPAGFAREFRPGPRLARPQGIIIIRNFIYRRYAAFGSLRGDERDFSTDPSAPYRTVVAWDTATGLVSYTIAPSNTRPGFDLFRWPFFHRPSREIPARKIAAGGGNSIEITDAGSDRMTVRLKGLNSLLWCCSNNQEVAIRSGPEGISVRIRGDDYPHQEVNQYRPKQPPRVLARAATGPYQGPSTIPGVSHRDVTWVDGRQVSDRSSSIICACLWGANAELAGSAQ